MPVDDLRTFFLAVGEWGAKFKAQGGWKRKKYGGASLHNNADGRGGGGVQVNADEITLKSLSERRSSVLVNGAIKRQIK